MLEGYIVLENFDYEGQRVAGLFATLEDAQAYIDSNPNNMFGNKLYEPNIEQWRGSEHLA